jgi:2-desacetyl-2-hydroxyethyl bacteriochlorophyllide A dehydrogenase
MPQASAWWITRPGAGEIRSAAVAPPGPGDVAVRTVFSGVSRGTESLVFDGRVPPDQFEAMKAPFQEGDFPGPVKYGYLNVGTVTAGPSDLAGRTVFCLYPHQTAYVVPASAVVPVPSGVPARRAVLAGMAETAVNALWDAAPRVGDRACVVGGGVLGCLTAWLLARMPGVTVTVVDTDFSRGAVARALGADFATPADIGGEHEVVIHTSATAAGLDTCLSLLPVDGVVTELSWYGTGAVALPLGGAFHSRRLGIRASQVGVVAPSRRATRSYRDRLALALQLLDDAAVDALLGADTAFRDLPHAMPDLLRRPGLCHVVRYDEEPATYNARTGEPATSNAVADDPTTDNAATDEE